MLYQLQYDDHCVSEGAVSKRDVYKPG